MKIYGFDIETNGLLDEVTTIHSLVVKDFNSGEVWSCCDQPDYKHPVGTIHTHGEREGYYSVAFGLAKLCEADLLVGHNILDYDIPVLRKLFPEWDTDESKVLDTLILARLIYPSEKLREIDGKLMRKGQIPAHAFGKHKLEAFGYRLGLQKGEYSAEMEAQGLDPWAAWNVGMQNYCELDVEVTHKLYDQLISKGYSAEAVKIEHRVSWMMQRQQAHGVLFDVRKAEQLYVKLVARKLALEADLKKTLVAFFKPKGAKADDGMPTTKVVTPAKTLNYRDPVKASVTAGCPYSPVEFTEFNPGSRDHIAIVLQRRYGWQPEEFTNGGKPKVDELVLSGLDFPEAKLIREYLLVCKRTAQVSEGDEGWLQKVGPDGRIRGRVNPTGAVTRRASHNAPNLAQVPKVGSPYGEDCRSLFIVPKGKKMVGVDQSGIELRMLAHYMHRYDGGKYAKAVVEGSNEDGTDVHSVNTRALGFDPTAPYTVRGKDRKGRDIGKTFIYAFLYGAGKGKIESITGAEDGDDLKAKFLRGLPALAKLISAVKLRSREDGFVYGLDGGIIYIRHAHAALNTLLQSAGAIAAKVWLIEMEDAFNKLGWLKSGRVAFVLWVHDEVQMEVDEEIADEVGRIAVECIERTGVRLGLRVPITGEAKVGNNWSDTH